VIAAYLSFSAIELDKMAQCTTVSDGDIGACSSYYWGEIC